MIDNLKAIVNALIISIIICKVCNMANDGHVNDIVWTVGCISSAVMLSLGTSLNKAIFMSVSNQRETNAEEAEVSAGKQE